MVLELGKAGDRDGADAAGATHEDRERAPVGGVLPRVQAGVWSKEPPPTRNSSPTLSEERP